MYEDSEPHFDWKAISRAMTIFLLSILISVGIIWSSYAYFQYSEDWKKKQNHQLTELKKQFKDVKSSLDIVQQDYLTDYDALVQRQFYTENKNISFEEQLLELRDYTMRIVDKTKLDLQLFASDWNISEKSDKYSLSWMVNTPSCEILETVLNVKLASLHEEHILKFLDRFYSDPPNGLFNLKSCNIMQLTPIQTDDVSKPYFKANCTFSWFIAKNRE